MAIYKKEGKKENFRISECLLVGKNREVVRGYGFTAYLYCEQPTITLKSPEQFTNATD